MLNQESTGYLQGKGKSHPPYVSFQITQHEFHSQREYPHERQETNHALDDRAYSTSNLANSRQSKVGSYKFASSLEFHINNPIRQILSQFKRILKEKGYKCREIFQNQLFIVRLTPLDKLKKLLFCCEPPKYILSIKTHQFRSVRVVSIKSLQSDFQHNRDQELIKMLHSNKKLYRPTSRENFQDDPESQYKQDIFSLDATSQYMFSKMLADPKYSMGQNINEVLKQYTQEIQNIGLNNVSRMKKSSFSQENTTHYKKPTFQQLIWLNLSLNEITNQMLQGFNCSRKELYQILCYCRKSIESYFRTGLLQQLEQNYDNLKEQNSEEMALVEEESIFSEQLLKNYSISIMHLKRLLSTSITIEIYQNLYLLCQFIQIQTCQQKFKLEKEKVGWFKQNSQQNTIRIQNKKKIIEQKLQLFTKFIKTIKQNYMSDISQKIKLLRAAGFSEKSYDLYLDLLGFNQTVSEQSLE